jgi:uncharacterized protein YgbK (DUF1537 family)
LKSISHQVLIIADDLTGACDAAAPFASRALPSRVAAYSTGTRDLGEPHITDRMQTVATAAGDARVIFKKIDSTLRGSIRAEIQAAMKVFQRTRAIVTPAFPDLGRTVKGGRLYVNRVNTGKTGGVDLLDAETNRDLDKIVSAAIRDDRQVLWAGSGGLAAALARYLYGEQKSRSAPRIDGAIIFCIGSDHPATVAQLAELHRLCSDAMVLPIHRGQTTPAEIRHALTGAAGVFLTGGDTAAKVLDAIGVDSIVIRHEMATGVPWGILRGGMLDGRVVVTKSGGFGGPDTLVQVADFCSRRKP